MFDICKASCLDDSLSETRNSSLWNEIKSTYDQDTKKSLSIKQVCASKKKEKREKKGKSGIEWQSERWVCWRILQLIPNSPTRLPLTGELNTKAVGVQRRNEALGQRPLCMERRAFLRWSAEFLRHLHGVPALLHEPPSYVHLAANLSSCSHLSAANTLLFWPWNAAVSFPSSRRQSWAAPSPLTASEAAHDRAHLFIYLKKKRQQLITSDSVPCRGAVKDRPVIKAPYLNITHKVREFVFGRLFLGCNNASWK